MGWFKDLFYGKPQNCVGGEPPQTTARSLDELYDSLVKDFKEYPSLIAVLDVDHSCLHTDRKISKKLYLKLFGNTICIVPLDVHSPGYLGVQELTRENILAKVASGYSNVTRQTTLKLDCKLNWIVPSSLPQVTEALVTNAITSAIPFTARQVFEGFYAIEKLEDGLVRYHTKNTEDGFNCYVTCDMPYWYTDLALSLGVIKLTEDPNAYTIIDQYQIDKNLLPKSHWRRWTSVTTAKDNAKAAVKYVPCDIGKGYVQYFDVTLDFDDPAVAGMAFDSCEMLGMAIVRQKIDSDKAIPDKVVSHNGYHPSGQPPKSRVSIEPENIKVIWQGKTYAFEDYLADQREAKTNLERPYLSGNQPGVSIDGNKISIDAQYYINYTPWTPKK